jgi:hypothetical protein
MACYVYENWVAEQKARVHLGSCAWCQDGRGCHGTTSGERGRWLGPFPTFGEAWAAAQRTGRRPSTCKRCNPR